MKEADIFSEALDRPVAVREEFLREACGGDLSLLKKVRLLLDIHEEDGGLLDEPVGELDDFPESNEEHELPSSREMLNKDGTQILYFGKYRLEGEIARRAMGVVYRAFQNSLKRIVAVKMIRSNMLASEDDVARFRTEAEAAGSLDHPNIVPIYEVGEFQGQDYFSMKLIEGGTLRDHLTNLQKNHIEYIAGTYAFDKDDRFGLKVIDVITTGTAPEESHDAHLKFLAIPGRTYRIGEWTGSGSPKPCQFSFVRDGSGLRTSLLASEVENLDVYVPMIDGESRFFVFSVE